MQEIRNRIKGILALEGTTFTETLVKYNQKYPKDVPLSAQGMTNKFRKGTIRYSEIEQFLDVLGYDIVLKDRKSGKEF